jgi:hypothetical protein
MSLTEIERQVRELPAADRHQFVSWAYAHENELVERPYDEAIVPEVMEELLRRRQEIAEGKAKIVTLDEFDAGMAGAIDEVRRSRH